jgi:cAMP-dependent protein kinase regulator
VWWAEQVPVLTHLDEGELASMADALETIYYETGDKIITQGDIGDHFYILETGQAEVRTLLKPL